MYDDQKKKLKNSYASNDLEVVGYYNAPFVVYSPWFVWEVLITLYVFASAVCALVHVSIKPFVSPLPFIVCFTVVMGLLWVIWLIVSLFRLTSRGRLTLNTEDGDEMLKPTPRHTADVLTAVIAILFGTVFLLASLWVWWVEYGGADVLTNHISEAAQAWKYVMLTYSAVSVGELPFLIKSVFTIAHPEGMREK